MSAVRHLVLLLASALLVGACGSSSTRWKCKFTCADGTERSVNVTSPVNREPCDDPTSDVKCPGGPILVCQCEVAEEEPKGPTPQTP